MSRDATGIYSAWATKSFQCPVCNAEPGTACNLQISSEYKENGTHWERTENAPPLEMSQVEEPSVLIVPMAGDEATPLQELELDAMVGDRIAVLHIVSSLRKYRAAAKTLLANYSSHDAAIASFDASVKSIEAEEICDD